MRINDFVWIRYGKYLGGLLLTVPLLQPLLFCLIFYFVSKTNSKLQININRVCTILLLVLFFVPIIMLTNALSFHLLGH